MPKTTKETSNHPCHFLSLPSAKRFWCRHCMCVFEDAISRWRHSRSCRYGVVNNFMRRRQLEAKALQNTTKPNPIEARLEQSVSPSEEPIVGDLPASSSSSTPPPSGSGEKTNQATCNDLFRCFICHNKFSTLEEMRHHVKYPCNNKKIVTDVPNPAVTVYIDEFTDRSRQWEPQPQQEEVITSEFVPNIVVSQEIVQSTLEVKNAATQESGHNSQAINISQNSQGTSTSTTNITPTNIYVNEQGETVIEVENLDLNSEGGELSLAHLLTQLSQQGIVFDKNKASQMTAQHEMETVSDPDSGEIYATGTTFDSSARMRMPLDVKEEDEGQSTVEDAANTLAQLANFRGYNTRTNMEVITGEPVPQMSVSTDHLQSQYILEGSMSEGYTCTESYAVPNAASAATNVHQINMTDAITSSVQPTIKVEYQYDYLPSGHPATADGLTTPQQISIQPPGILDPSSSTSVQHLGNLEIVKEETDSINNRVQSQSVPISAVHRIEHHGQIHPQVVTYISSPSTMEHRQTQPVSVGDEGTMLVEDFVVEESSVSPQQQQYHYQQQPQQQQHSNISVSMSSDRIITQNEDSRQHPQQQQQHTTSIPAAVLDTNQNSYIVFSTEDNTSTQILCSPDDAHQDNQNELTTISSDETVHHTAPVSDSSTVSGDEIIENHLIEQQQQQQQQEQYHMQASNEVGENGTNQMKDTEEFEVQMVTLQEIAETETEDSSSVSFSQNHSNFSIEQTPTVDNNNTTVEEVAFNTSSSNNNDNTTANLQPTHHHHHQTLNDPNGNPLQIDVPVLQETTTTFTNNNNNNNNIVPNTSSEIESDSFGCGEVVEEVQIEIQEYQQSPPPPPPLCQEAESESVVMSSNGTLHQLQKQQEPVPPMYVVSSHDDLQLLTSSSTSTASQNLAQQQTPSQQQLSQSQSHSHHDV